MSKKLSMLHLSSLSLWYMGKGKGRLSIFLPLKYFSDRGDFVRYASTSETQSSGQIENIIACRIALPFETAFRKWPSFFKLYSFFVQWIVLLLKGYSFARHDKTDVIYAHSSDTALPAFLLSKLIRSKYVLRLYGIGNPHKSYFSRLKLNLALSLKADAYIITNDGTSGYSYAIKRGVPKDKIHFLKNGINKEYWKRNYNTQLRESIAPNNERVIITASRLMHSKQVHLIVEALEGLVRKKQDVKLVIVGDGNELNFLQDLVSRLNLEKYVLFTGSLEQSKVIDYVVISDIFVSMNALSSMSNPVFEAMACKKTVVALNTGATEDLIVHNKTGVLVEPDQLHKLPDILFELLSDEAKMKQIGEQAFCFIDKEWPTWEQRIEHELSIVDNICAGL